MWTDVCHSFGFMISTRIDVSLLSELVEPVAALRLDAARVGNRGENQSFSVGFQFQFNLVGMIWT